MDGGEVRHHSQHSQLLQVLGHLRQTMTMTITTPMVQQEDDRGQERQWTMARTKIDDDKNKNDDGRGPEQEQQWMMMMTTMTMDDDENDDGR